MAKYTFRCYRCEEDVQKHVNPSVEVIACNNCGGNMNRLLPSSGSQAVNEVIDSFTGVRRDQNHDDIKQERRDQHYWEVEVPRLIQTYSLETCLENKWLVYNEKGDLVINKPPSKR